MNYSIVHLYSQYREHYPARIIATREGLLGLATALIKAATSGKEEYVTMAADGEGYGIEIERTNDTGLRIAPLPYNEDRWAV